MVTHPNRSSATQAYRLLLAWDFHPLVIRAVEAHVRDMEVGTNATRLQQHASSPQDSAIFFGREIGARFNAAPATTRLLA